MWMFTNIFKRTKLTRSSDATDELPTIGKLMPRKNMLTDISILQDLVLDGKYYALQEIRDVIRIYNSISTVKAGIVIRVCEDEGN